MESEENMDATQTVKKLQEMREGGYLSDAIMREAVKHVKAANDDFNWVGVYLHKPEEKLLWLHNYMGAPTEHAKIEVGQGVCGTAVAEGENQNIPDVSEVDNYLACSPKTKSELVVLIRAGDEILGQIDIDSNRKNAFGKDEEQGVQAVADKLAEVLMAERR
ncbi:MAG: GAF domain-containing protein [Longimicrobiales bacterium]